MRAAQFAGETEFLPPSPASFTTSPHGAFRPPFQPVENADQIGHDREDRGQKFNAHGLASSLFESAPPACGPRRGGHCRATGPSKTLQASNKRPISTESPKTRGMQPVPSRSARTLAVEMPSGSSAKHTGRVRHARWSTWRPVALVRGGSVVGLSRMYGR